MKRQDRKERQPKKAQLELSQVKKRKAQKHKTMNRL